MDLALHAARICAERDHSALPPALFDPPAAPVLAASRREARGPITQRGDQQFHLGLGNTRILVLHALKNAANPIVTTIGFGIASLIGGVVVTETVFAIPGIGRLTIDAVIRRDFPVIQGVILLFSAVYVLINLVIDLSYALFDPRIRY